MRPEESRKRAPTTGRLSRHFLTGEDSTAVLRLALRVIETPGKARLVTSVRGTPATDPGHQPASPPAVPVPAVTRRADREGCKAPPARQQVQDDPRQEPPAQTASVAHWTSRPDGAILPRHKRLSHPRPDAAPTAPGLFTSERDNTQFLGGNADAASPRMRMRSNSPSTYPSDSCGSRPPFTTGSVCVTWVDRQPHRARLRNRL